MVSVAVAVSAWVGKWVSHIVGLTTRGFRSPSHPTAHGSASNIEHTDRPVANRKSVSKTTQTHTIVIISSLRRIVSAYL